MGKREKILFTLFVMITQLLQFLLVYSIAWFNHRTIEFFFIFFSFQINRMMFGKSYHADSLSKCTLITLVIFYLLIKGVIPLNISLFATPLFGVYLSYVLNIIQELIDNQEVPRPFVKKKLREQIIEILGDDLSEVVEAVKIIEHIKMNSYLMTALIMYQVVFGIWTISMDLKEKVRYF